MTSKSNGDAPRSFVRTIPVELVIVFGPESKLG